ncbi:type 11 methyltransferase [Hyphomicrobium denitrificans 1NES1]|uniref:Type 11 methyltransferase n=1 Tax=Hyphomicrobium denitrificans 1NES1 TaxID=670307 RepID=N0BEK6_9HYPH|nr:class I SAM-dependent methyltransferase [Hyphomicrobium denitrificans]AGK58931.1 type 11 methyltransferase [Hyphomicrobium denitrificans 1NES1]
MSESAAGAMDVIYRHQRYIYDLTRRHYLLGRDQLIADLTPPPGGSVLEIGCGTARNLICAARRYPGARFFGVDVSEEMLKTARSSIARSHARNRIQVAQADATAFCPETLFAQSSFDRIFISYALSMIPAWEAVLDQAAGKLAPKGTLHVVDFGTMDGMPGFARHTMLAWLTHFSVTPHPNLQAVVRSVAERHGLRSAFHQGRFGYAALAKIGH